jgi:hypothetical protein
MSPRVRQNTCLPKKLNLEINWDLVAYDPGVFYTLLYIPFYSVQKFYTGASSPYADVLPRAQKFAGALLEESRNAGGHRH